MNVGQILETHLGWACANLGRQIGDFWSIAGRTVSARKALKDRLEHVYGDETGAEIRGYSEGELLDWLGNESAPGRARSRRRCSTVRTSPTSCGCSKDAGLPPARVR